MKAIIIAAGMGTRLAPLTDDKPKCMLEIEGKPLIEHQLCALREAGIKDIAIVKGYKKENIRFSGVEEFVNTDYQNNNILHSLFYAEDAMDNGFIAVYSDIYYQKQIVERLIKSTADISVVVDIDWRGYYEGRTDHPIEEAENVIFDADNNLVKIGKILPDKDDVHGEFIGMMKCSARGADLFKRYFHRLKSIYSGKAFQRAKVFEKAYLTDIFQDMADYGVKVNCVIVEKGWAEIDTVQDYQRVIEENKL